MKKENIEALLSEIINSNGFINLDASDINAFKAGVESIDAIKVVGRYEQAGELLSGAITTLKQENKENSVKKLLFSMKLSSKDDFMMEDMNKIREALDMLDEDVECVWGLSTGDEISNGNIELIVAIGFIPQH